MQQISPLTYSPVNMYSTQQTGSPNTVEQITEQSVSELSDKMEKIALIYAVANTEESQNSNWLLKTLLLEVLFGNTSGTSAISADEQAQMINEIISSGQPGSIAKAMGQNNMATSYTAGGAAVASVPVGGMVSVNA